MAGELLKAMAGVDIVHIPYKGSSGARTDILGGQVQMMFDAITTMAPNVRAGKLRALGTSGKRRSTVLPDVPTIARPAFPATRPIWLGIMAPAGTPKAIVDKLNAEVVKIVSNSDVVKAWKAQGASADADERRRVHALPRPGHRQVGADRQGLGRQARAATPASLSFSTSRPWSPC